MSKLENNPDLFKIDGVIGRMDYFLNSCKLTGLFLLALLPIGLGSALGSVGIVLGGLVSFCVALPIFYFGFNNNFKRLRDIRGTTENETLLGICMVVILIIPYVNVVANLILLFCEGAVTGNNKSTGEFVDSISRSFGSKHHESDHDKIESLEKLHKLKQAGAITEDEFNKYKEEALKKIAS